MRRQQHWIDCKQLSPYLILCVYLMPCAVCRHRHMFYKIKPQNYLQIYSQSRLTPATSWLSRMRSTRTEKPFQIHPLLISHISRFLSILKIEQGRTHTHSTLASERKCENYTCSLHQPSTLLRLLNKQHSSEVAANTYNYHTAHTHTPHRTRQEIIWCDATERPTTS